MAATFWRVALGLSAAAELDPQEAPVEQEVRNFHVGTAAERQKPGG